MPFNFSVMNDFSCFHSTSDWIDHRFYASLAVAVFPTSIFKHVKHA